MGGQMFWSAGRLEQILGPLGHTFEKERTQNDIFNEKIGLLAEKYPFTGRTKVLGRPDLACGRTLSTPALSY